MKELVKGKSIAKIFKGLVKSFDEKTHTATIFISTGDIDRDMEVIEPKAFQARLGNYLAHPILLSSHRQETLTRNIGKALEIKITAEGVEGTYEWFVGKGNPEADWGWFLVTKGIAAFSVGFMPHAWLDKWSTPMISPDDSARGIQRRFTDIELLENSQVLVPANPNALQRHIENEIIDDVEKEMCELVVKTVKEDEMRAFDRPTSGGKTKDQEEAPAAKPEDQIKDLQNRIGVLENANKESTEKLTQLAAQVEGLADAIKTLSPKHYSALLMEGGDIDPKRTSTGEGEEVSKGGVVAVDNKSIAEAVKSGIKEGLKK